MNQKIHVFVVSKLNIKIFHLRMMKQNAPLPREKNKSLFSAWTIEQNQDKLFSLTFLSQLFISKSCLILATSITDTASHSS